MAAIPEAIAKPWPWSVFLPLVEGFTARAEDGVQVPAQLRYARPAPWQASDATGRLYGLADWQGADGFTVSWQGDVGRMAGSGARSRDVYRRGEVFAVAPDPIFSAAVYDAGAGERRLLVVALTFDGMSRYTVYARPLSALPSSSTTPYNALTAPTGWRTLGHFPLPTDTVFATAYGFMAFNELGTQGRRMVLVGATKGQRVAHSVRVDIAGDVATWTDEGPRGPGLRRYRDTTFDIRANDNYTSGDPSIDLDWTRHTRDRYSGSQGFLVDYQGTTPVYLDYVGFGEHVESFTLVSDDTGSASNTTTAAGVERGLALRGAGLDIPLETRIETRTYSHQDGNPATVNDALSLELRTAQLRAVDLRRGVAVWSERTERNAQAYGGSYQFGNETLPGTVTRYHANTGRHAKEGAFAVDSAPPDVEVNTTDPTGLPVPAFFGNSLAGVDSVQFDDTFSQDPTDGATVFGPYLDAQPMAATDRDGNVFISQPVPPFASPQQYFNYLTGGDLPTLSGLDVSADRYHNIGQF